MTMFKSVWLFRFTSYTFCQGTRDDYEDMRLVNLSLPCEEWEAKMYLVRTLDSKGMFYEEDSIKSLNINIINS